jgi:hypothetical protein
MENDEEEESKGKTQSANPKHSGGLSDVKIAKMPTNT